MKILRKLGQSILAALMALACSLPVTAAETPAAAPRVDTTIRALIEQTVVAIVRGDTDLNARFEALRDPGIGDRQTVLLQIALYLEHSTGTEQSMAGALILQHLAFTPEEKLRTILPHLDAADPGLRRVFTELLGTIDRPEGGEPDFGFYETWLGKQRGSPPWALIRYLYEVSPDAALASMERVYGAGPTGHDEAAVSPADLRRLLAERDTGAAWSDRDRARVQTALEMLSRDPGWWRRLYVASILISNPDLATADMTKRLRNDSNPLVAAARIR